MDDNRDAIEYIEYMASIPDEPPFDIREQLARIDKMRAETLKLQEEREQVIALTRKTQQDALKVEQDARFAPWTIGFTGVGAGAALMAAALALAKTMLG